MWGYSFDFSSHPSEKGLEWESVSFAHFELNKALYTDSPTRARSCPGVPINACPASLLLRTEPGESLPGVPLGRKRKKNFLKGLSGRLSTLLYEIIWGDWKKMPPWFSSVRLHWCSVCWIINRNKRAFLSVRDANVPGKSHFHFILDAPAHAMVFVSAGLLSC